MTADSRPELHAVVVGSGHNGLVAACYLARGYHFPGDARPFAILGARLPLRPRDAGPATS